MEDGKIVELLDGEIVNVLETLDNMELGSDLYEAGIDSLAKLHKLRMEEIKTKTDFEEKAKRREMEDENQKDDLELRKSQAKGDDLKQYLKLGVEAAGIILPLVFYASWMKKGFKFEEEGTFTSTTFRGLFNCFKPTKR